MADVRTAAHNRNVIVRYLRVAVIVLKSEIDYKTPAFAQSHTTSAFEKQKRNLYAKTAKFPFHQEAKYLTAVTGYLDAARGNKAKTTNVLLRETNI